MADEHFGGSLWRAGRQFRTRDPETSAERTFPKGTDLSGALRHASQYEDALLQAKKGKRLSDQLSQKGYSGGYWGEAWQTPHGKALVSALGVDPSFLTDAQQTKLTWDCINLSPSLLSNSKQYSAEMAKIDRALKATQRLISDLQQLGPRPLYAVNPMDQTDPLVLAWDVEQSLIHRQREFVNIIGKLKPGKRLPEDKRNAYIASATRIFLRWFEDQRPRDKLGVNPTSDPASAIPKTNTGGVYHGPVWSFLEGLFAEMSKAHPGDEQLRSFFSVSCNQSSPAKAVLLVLCEAERE